MDSGLPTLMTKVRTIFSLTFQLGFVEIASVDETSVRKREAIKFQA
jgi:hypothetical protein